MCPVTEHHGSSDIIIRQWPGTLQKQICFKNAIKVISAILRDDSCESDEDLSGPPVVYRILPESLWK